MALDELGAEFGLRTQASRLENNRHNPTWFVVHHHSARCHKSFAPQPPSETHGPYTRCTAETSRSLAAAEALSADDVLEVPCRNDMDVSA